MVSRQNDEVNDNERSLRTFMKQVQKTSVEKLLLKDEALAKFAKLEKKEEASKACILEKLEKLEDILSRRAPATQETRAKSSATEDMNNERPVPKASTPKLGCF